MKNNKKVLILSLLMAVCLLFTGCSLTPDDIHTAITGEVDLKVHYLDVGQGDSIFIELPNDRTMLIDASVYNYGLDIANYIKNKGYDKIDYLVATHPHADHIGGMKDVVNNLDIGQIYMPKVNATTKTYKNLLLAIKEKGLQINTAKAGVNILDENGLTINILAPNSESYKSLNNYSAVIKLTYKNRSFLFMGDAETESEKEITADVSADVLKVGHHGSTSSTSKSFLKKVNPVAAVISCGKDNSYGHPHKETLKKLEDAGVDIYRTDTMGTIIASTDGESLDITKNNPAVWSD